MVVNGTDEIGISEKYWNGVKDILNIKLDVKKIDVGGIPVHGDIEDFVDDASSRLVLGHTHNPFTPRQLEIGDEVKFGEIDTLIKDKP